MQGTIALGLGLASATATWVTSTDMLHRRVSNRALVFGSASMLLTWIIASWLTGSWWILGAAVLLSLGYAVPVAVAWWLTPARIGGGDVKLWAFCGLVAGPFGLLTALVLVPLSTLVVATVMSRRVRRTQESSLPFAPILCIGTWLGIAIGTIVAGADMLSG